VKAWFYPLTKNGKRLEGRGPSRHLTPNKERNVEDAVRAAIWNAVAHEPFARALGMRLVALSDGYAKVEMIYQPDKMNNIYQYAHGGAIYALIDEAFEASSQTSGTIAVALNVNVTYVSPPQPQALLLAESRILNQTKKTALYDIKVIDERGQLIANCQALAYRTGRPIPFITKT
jgi:acyl-CoA thioesterase